MIHVVLVSLLLFFVDFLHCCGVFIFNFEYAAEFGRILFWNILSKISKSAFK